MNIFATSECPVQSAKDHCDVHNRKMIVEAVQLLSTAHVVLDKRQVAYKATHQNHPSNIWCRESKANYDWLWNHAKALCDEYTHRTGKIHKSSDYLDVLRKAPVNCADKGLTEIRRAMPDSYILASLNNPYKSYQMYLNDKFKEWQTRTDKKQMKVEWTNRNKPNWVV